MPDYGVTTTGFVRKPIEIILQEIRESLWADVSPTLDQSPESPQGQINAAFARQGDLLWAQAEILYHAFDPDTATDSLLQILAKLTQTARRPASKGTVPVLVNLDEGTTLEAGVHYANVTGQEDNRWTPREDFTAPSTGEHAIVFEAEQTGPVQAFNGTLTVINTSLTGWNSVTNAVDATVGRVADNDDTLRERREADLAQAGSATARAIEADVNDVDGVLSVHVFENKGSSTDANGLPPHSIEAVIDDGEVPAADDDELAQAVFTATSAGIQYYSSDGNGGTATDEDGAEHVVGFSRVEYVDIHFAYELETGAGYVGDAAVQAYVKAQAEALYAEVLGPELLYFALAHLPLDLLGVTDVLSFALDTTAAPTATDNIQLGTRQRATFDTSNIDITIA